MRHITRIGPLQHLIPGGMTGDSEVSLHAVTAGDSETERPRGLRVRWDLSPVMHLYSSGSSKSRPALRARPFCAFSLTQFR